MRKLDNLVRSLMCFIQAKAIHGSGGAVPPSREHSSRRDLGQERSVWSLRRGNLEMAHQARSEVSL